MQDMAPILFTFIRDSGISVAAALQDNRWIRDIKGGLSSSLAIADYLKLWNMTADVNLSHDKAVWRYSKDGIFSVSSAYKLFADNTLFACAKPIWKSKAPMKCKFFMWLVVHKRCLTADNLARRGWPHNPICALCSSENESCSHLFVQCHFTLQVWHHLRLWSGSFSPIPAAFFTTPKTGHVGLWVAAQKRAPSLTGGISTLSSYLYTGEFGRNETPVYSTKRRIKWTECLS